METLNTLVWLLLVGELAVIALLTALLLRRPKDTVDLNARAEAIARALTETLRREVTEVILREERNNQSTLRTELQNELRSSRRELTEALQLNMEKLGQSLRDSQRETAELQATRIGELTEAEKSLMGELKAAQTQQFAQQDARLETMQVGLNRLLSERMDGMNRLLSERMDGLNNTVGQRLSEVERRFGDYTQQSTTDRENLRKTLEERMTAMQSSNRESLEQMRATVDEKLQKTLNERISQSFQAVNERLADVYKGLGEMQTLAGDVGDLKKVMAGVKTRGILGELQLGAILSEMLSPEQYEENVVTRPGTQNRVEFAIKLPGEGDVPLYLPVDAKFPADAYHHLVDAYEAGDTEAIKQAKAELETRIKGAAKDIRDKYVAPPYTTTFGIMFLPFEGLYAEVVRMGLVEVLQSQYRVSVAGPTTLAALLNSLQMGFRTLAIQKRSGEVWEVLGAVKTEFGNFEKVLTKAKEKLDQTGNELDKLIGVRTRQINRRLSEVAELPTTDARRLLDAPSSEEES